MPSRASMTMPRQDMGQPEPEGSNHGFDAWIAGLEQKIPYDLEALTRGDRVGRQALKIMTFDTNEFQGPRAMERAGRHVCLPFPSDHQPAAVVQSGFVHLFRLSLSHLSGPRYRSQGGSIAPIDSHAYSNRP
jgi:hypothetical protein